MKLESKWALYAIAVVIGGLALQLVGSYAVGVWGSRVGALKWLTASLSSQGSLDYDLVYREMRLAARMLADSIALDAAERHSPEQVRAVLEERMPADDAGGFWAWVPGDAPAVTSDPRCVGALAQPLPIGREQVLRCDGVSMLVLRSEDRPEIVVGFTIDGRYAARLRSLTNAETAVFVDGAALATTTLDAGQLSLTGADLPQPESDSAIGFGERSLVFDGYRGFDVGDPTSRLPVASGEGWFVATRTVGDTGLTIALLVPTSFMRLGTFYNTIFMIPISIALAALLALLVWKVLARFTKPVAALVRSAHAVSAGDLDQSVPVPAAVEMRELCQTYNAMLEKLRETMGLRQQLAREVGRSEVATGVLHNVGNVLNGVNVSVGLATESLRRSRVPNLEKAVAMLLAHADDLGAFLRDDERGQKLLPYLDKLTAQLVAEREKVMGELDNLTAGVDHVKNVVRTQQSYAKAGGLSEKCRLRDLVDDALRLESASLANHRIEVSRDEVGPELVHVDKHKTLQILVNLVTNAKQAVNRVGRGGGSITVRSAVEDGRARIEVVDDGDGIPEENMARIFGYGFTTNRDGHGFGLHNSANAASEMGGALRCRSDGQGRGSTFTLELPAA